MIGICISSAWPQYYAASPYNNILSTQHGKFKHMECLPHEIDRDAVNACEAIITDDVLVDALSFYTNGPKLMIGGDLHAHDIHGVRRRELDFAGSDFVLSGGVFTTPHPNYKYFNERYRDQLVYLPNSVPDNAQLPVLPPWHCRKNEVQCAGSVSDVYPFRKSMQKFTKHINNLPREQYFTEIAKYKAGLTCPSILGYVVAKYFEIPWVGSLLIAGEIESVEMDLLGFNNYEHGIFTDDPKRFIDKIRLGEQSADFQEMAIQAESLVRKRHTASRRLEYISLIVAAIIKGNFKPDDAFTLFRSIL